MKIQGSRWLTICLREIRKPVSMASLPKIELEIKDIEKVQESMRQAMDKACYDALTSAGTYFLPRWESSRMASLYTPTIDWARRQPNWHSTEFDWTYGWKPRKVKVVKSVYQVWVVRKVDDEIFAGGVSVVATSAKNAEFKVLQNLGVMDVESVYLYSKCIFDLE